MGSRFPYGAPQELLDAIVNNFARRRAGTVGLRTDYVARLLGRPPATFAIGALAMYALIDRFSGLTAYRHATPFSSPKDLP